MILRVELNGTDVNPYHALGLTQNPFPQLAKREFTASCLAVQSLGGDPIPDTDYIKQRLKGFTPEFIKLCCEKFVPGKLVSFEVEFPD